MYSQEDHTCSICKCHGGKLHWDRVLRSVGVCDECHGTCVSCGGSVSAVSRNFCKGCQLVAKEFAKQEHPDPEPTDLDEMSEHSSRALVSPITHHSYPRNVHVHRYDEDTFP